MAKRFIEIIATLDTDRRQAAALFTLAAAADALERERAVLREALVKIGNISANYYNTKGRPNARLAGRLNALAVINDIALAALDRDLNIDSEKSTILKQQLKGD